MNAQNILIIGGGGREHALAFKFRQSPFCGQLFIASGNYGTAQCGQNIAISPNDFEALAVFSLANDINMVFVGPEEPLVRGIVDYFEGRPDLAHISMVGPSAEGAQLEGSKAYAKAFMSEFDIPTAMYRAFTAEDMEAGLDFIANSRPPFVLKADGLAGGKGVVILTDVAETQAEFREMLGGKFGSAGARVVIEQFLDGIEFSVFAFTDGENYQILPIAKDYKRVGEGDTGLNTGGMGAVSPLPFVDTVLLQKVEDRIIRPTIRGLKKRGIRYRGVVFFGLIRVDDDPYVIEYNCRMGDPETEVVIPRLRSDLVSLCSSLFDGTLATQSLVFDPRTAATIMLVAGGYPGDYTKGHLVSGVETTEGSLVFHAGTQADTEGNIRTQGGRLIAVTSYGNTIEEAVTASKKNAERIEYMGKYYRQDIGFDL